MVHRGDDGWRVAIVEPDGREVSTRSCRDEVEARTYASTVRQHVEWLSEPKFREYYSIAGDRWGAGGLMKRADQAGDSPPGAGGA